MAVIRYNVPMISKGISMKISDISEYVGFGTIRSFNRAFRTVMGVTPVEYRCGLNELSNQQ